MTILELLAFLAPGLTASDEDRQKAIDLAISYRPACLTEALQDEAQALYAAWLLSMNAQQAVTGVVGVGVKREREGDLEREWFDASGLGIDSMGFKARYDLLADRCKVGNARLYRGACIK